MHATQETSFRFGAEVYTWFMHNEGRTHAEQLPHMINVAAQAGFSGIEPIYFWMGKLKDPDLLSDALNKAGVKLAALVLALEWNGAKETSAEQAGADSAIALLQHFPGALLCTVQKPSGRYELCTRRKRLVTNINTVSQRAAERGISCSFHPNSPHGSITRTKEDYAYILEGLDARVTGWTPDVGHIINGGMDPLQKMKEYQSLINHIHFKDWNGTPEFTIMGNGKIDFVTIMGWLQQIGYKGWIVCEDEGPEAVEYPDDVTRHDGRWIYETLLPQLKNNNAPY